MKESFKKMDKLLFVMMIIYTILGLVMIFSASSITAVLYNHVSESYFFKKQLLVVVISWLFGLFFVLNFPTAKYRRIAPIGMVLITASLILLIPYGTITNSARSWYDLGFYNFQPSEFVKSIMIVYLAIYFDKIIKRKDLKVNKIIFPFILVIIAFAFIAYQPDLGTAMIVAGIAGLIFLFLPINTKDMKKAKGIALITAIVGIIIIMTYTLNAEQSDRLKFQKPCTRYTEKTGYQVCNGLIAISNGGLFGVGLGNSTQKYLYLPEAHTDFIFPIICEELGAVAGSIIIIGFFVMLMRILNIARKAVTIRGQIIAFGTFCYILLHLLVNFMGILALIPLTGVPVPFLSYGGSFYLNLIFLLFLTERVQIETNNNRTKELVRSL
jgi:cell division protein FtsW